MSGSRSVLHLTHLCVPLSALLSLLLRCFSIITVAIDVCGLIRVAVHLVCCQLVFFLFFLRCRRFTVWVLLLFLFLQLVLLLLL